MSAPNIVQLNYVYGNTSLYLANTVTTPYLTNVVGTNSVIKINSIFVTNYSANVANSYIDLYRGGIAYPISGNTQIPPNSTLVVSGKDMQFYLVEGDSLRASSNASNSVSVATSYETIS